MQTVLRALLLCCALPLFAVDLGDLLRGARERDLECKRLSLGLENAGISMARAKAGRGMQFALDSSGVMLTQELGPFADYDDTYVSTGNGLSFSLGEPLNTRFGVSVPLSWSTGTDTTSGGVRTGAGVSVTQPINPLLGWTPHAAEDMALRGAREKAQMELRSRESALKREVVSGVRTLVALEQRLFDAEASSRDARAELEKTRALQTYGEGSYAIRRLEGTLAGLEKEKAQTSAEMDLRRAALERKTGASLDGSRLSASLTLGEPRPVSSFTAEPAANQAVYLAGLAVDLAAERSKEEGFKDLPVLSVRGGYNFYTVYLKDVLYWYHYPAVSLSVSWKVFDNGTSRLDAESLRNELAMARIGFQEAEEAFRASWAEIVLSARDMETRRDRFLEQKALQELELAEKLDAFREGIATGLDVEQTRTRMQRLSFDDLLLRCDEWLLSLQAEALNPAVH